MSAPDLAPPPVSSRVSSRWTVPVLVLLAALAVAAGWLDVLTADVPSPVAGVAWPSPLGGLALGVPGALLLRRLPRHRVAWVMALGGLLWCLDAVAGAWTVYAAQAEPGTPGASAAWIFHQRLGAVLLLPLPLVLLLFPDGSLPRQRWLRVPSLVTIGAVCSIPLVLALVPSRVALPFHDERLPAALRGLELDPVSVPLPYPVWAALLTVGLVATLTSLVVPVLVVLGRFWRADAERRAQVSWLLLAGGASLVGMLSSRLLPQVVVDLALPLMLIIVSGAVVVAVTRCRLYRLDLLVGWTLLYGALAALVVVVDVTVFTLAGSVVSSRESALLATFAVALLYRPLRVRLHQTVQRLVRGRRDDPYAVVSALDERLEDSSDPDAQTRRGRSATGTRSPPKARRRAGAPSRRRCTAAASTSAGSCSPRPPAHGCRTPTSACSPTSCARLQRRHAPPRWPRSCRPAGRPS